MTNTVEVTSELDVVVSGDTVVLAQDEVEVIAVLEPGPPGPMGPTGPQGPPGVDGIAAPGTALPLVDGIATVGFSTAFSRQDHIHPTDTSRLATTGGTLTGPLVLPGDPVSALQAAPKQYADAVRTYAAPLDALAYNGIQINGGMDVDQANSGAAVVATNTFVTIVDNFKVQCQHASAVFQAQQLSISTNPPFYRGHPYAIRLIATTGGNVGSGAANDIARFVTYIEGYRINRLRQGDTVATGFTISFWISCTIPGTACLAVSNAASDRTYLAEFTVNAASTFEYKSIFVPGDTTGTWLTTNGVGLSISISSLHGTDWRGVAGWQADFKLCTAATTNFFASNNNAMYITGFSVFPGTQAPTAAQSPLIMRPYDQELMTCFRYYRKYVFPIYMIGHVSSVSAGSAYLPLAVPMRIVPEVTFSAPGDFGLSIAGGGLAFNAMSTGNLSTTGVQITWTIATTTTADVARFVANTNSSAAIMVNARM